MSMAISADPAPLRADEGGIIRVGSTRVTLQSLVYAYLDGATPEEIAREYPSLELADIHSTIAYYLRHRAEVQRYMEAERLDCETGRREMEKLFPPDALRDRLLARRDENQKLEK